MRNGAIAVLLVVAILAGAGAGYFVGNTSTGIVTSVSTTSLVSTTTTTLYTTTVLTSTEREITTSWSTVTAPSLELITMVYPAVITAGQNVSITFGVYNALPTAVTVNSPPFPNQYLPSCGTFLPMTFYIYEGHVTFSDLNSNTPLLLYNASIPFMCPAPYNVTLTFQPYSDTATFFLNLTRSISLNYTHNYSGFWLPCNKGSNLPTYCFDTFTPNHYTVLFNDTWGQQELEYFTVNP